MILSVYKNLDYTIKILICFYRLCFSEFKDERPETDKNNYLYDMINLIINYLNNASRKELVELQANLDKDVYEAKINQDINYLRNESNFKKDYYAYEKEYQPGNGYYYDENSGLLEPNLNERGKFFNLFAWVLDRLNPLKGVISIK